MSAIDNIQKNIELLWEKFKSPLGHSSIGNKFNSMYDLEKFLKQSHISFIESEVERLEGEKKYTVGRIVQSISDFENAYNKALQKQIDYYKKTLALIKEL